MKKRIIRVIFASIFLLIFFSFSAIALHSNLEEQKMQISLWNDQIIKYIKGSSSLSLERISLISQQRKEEMIDLMKRSPASALLLILQKEIRDKLPAEVQNNIEKDFIGLGRLVMIIVDKEDGEEELFQLTREDVVYDLFIANTESLTPNTYYRVSGFILDNKLAVESIMPLLGITKDELASINSDANGNQPIAIVLIGFKDKPFSYPGAVTKEEVDWAIKAFAQFYFRESYNRMDIDYKVFEYTIDKAIADYSDGDETYTCPEYGPLLTELKELREAGNLNFIPEEYNTIYGIFSEDFCGSIAGVSYVGNGNMGRFGWTMYGISQIVTRKDMEASLIAHEIGHTRGLGHVASGTCRKCLMYPSLNYDNVIDQAIFLQSQKDQLGWDLKLPLPLTISNIKIWPIGNIQGDILGATLLWNENYYTSSEVYFGTDYQNLQWKGSRSILDATTQRRFDLRGPEVNGKPTPLQIDTVYYYKIISTGIQEPVKGVTTIRRGSFFLPGKWWVREPENPGDKQGFGEGIVVDQSTPFLRGDSNEDSRVDISDAVHILGVLFQGEPMPLCPNKADTNDDGRIDLSDAVYLLGVLFQGKKPFPPYSGYGFDPTVDSLPECSF